MYKKNKQRNEEQQPVLLQGWKNNTYRGPIEQNYNIAIAILENQNSHYFTSQ